MHTFRFVDAGGKGTFVKFHWKPKLGVHSLVWDEAQEVMGRDPDFNRRDLWETIEAGQYPEWELGVQLVPEQDEHQFDFDLLDATKIIPEEQVPVRPIGRMVLDRNPDNFFAETEQVAFCTANVVPGIDFTNDPLLQARNFSYLDTQLIRLGGPNFAHIPVNRPVVDVRNNQRDGYHQEEIHRGANYSPNSLGGGCPALGTVDEGAYRHLAERVDGVKIRRRSPSFEDHYTQAAMFWHSMADWEKRHIVDAFRFELGKVDAVPVRERTVEQLAHVDHELATAVAEGIGVAAPTRTSTPDPRPSPALSLVNNQGENTIATRQIALLATDGVDAHQASVLRDTLRERGAVAEVLAPHDGTVRAADGTALTVDRALPTVAAVLYDAVVLTGGSEPGDGADGDAARRFVRNAYRHGKPVAAYGPATTLLTRLLPDEVRLSTPDGEVTADRGVVSAGTADSPFTEEFVKAVAAHRFRDRPVPRD
ncbi:hypothetical protein Sgou_04990 [Streptomyces gougerotii]|uniref:catalase n=1 Tax=Streptomyces gougerotii TaxID=53448 RepID=A0ABQ1CZS7_9ACTN|nr:hypothetical protein Sgou_04990 [Streptomyces gougerotii]